MEKFSGDAPDITAGKEIFATLRLNWEGSVNFFGGEGVGTVTLPGLGPHCCLMVNWKWCWLRSRKADNIKRTNT